MVEAAGDNPSLRRIPVLEFSRFAPDSGERKEQLARLEGRGVTVEPMTSPGGGAPGR